MLLADRRPPPRSSARSASRRHSLRRPRSSAPADGAVFYQVLGCRTLLSGAKLRGASFFQADLSGARSDGALLGGATFHDARDVPAGLQNPLDASGTHRSEQPAPSLIRHTRDRRILISVPSHRSMEHQAVLDRSVRALAGFGLGHEELSREDHPRFGALGELNRRMSGCCSAAVSGFGQLYADEAVVLPGRPDAGAIRSAVLPAPWNHIETGMAFTPELPILVLAPPDLAGGVLDPGISEQAACHLALDSEWQGSPVLGERASAAVEPAFRGR